MSYKGLFTPSHPEKYKGDVTRIVFRSLWERNVMTKLDTWDAVIEWNSEELAIPYRSPIDGRLHRYFPDFEVTLNTSKGIKKTIIEVKPKKQLQPPKKPKRKTKNYMFELSEYAKNMAKWQAAKAYCDDKGWEWLILTEDQIFGSPTK